MSYRDSMNTPLNDSNLQLYKLCDFISIDKLHGPSFMCNENIVYFIDNPDLPHEINWHFLSRCENAVHLLEKHLDKINWRVLSYNPNAVHLLKKHPEKIHWQELCWNTSFLAIEWLASNPDKINWSALSANPAAIDLLLKKAEEEDARRKANPDWLFDLQKEYPLSKDPYEEKLICWENFWINPLAIPYLEKHPEKIVWSSLSRNPEAMSLLQKNPDQIVWSDFCMNTHPDMIPLLEKNIHKLEPMDWYMICSWSPHILYFVEKYPDKIDWRGLSRNQYAMPLLRKNLDKIDWGFLSSNEAIFELDFRFLKKRMEPIREELLSVVMHPDRIHRFLDPTEIQESWNHLRER